MNRIITRRYYLSDFMYDNYKDDPTNIYDGFFVDLMPDMKHENYTEFWLGHDDYACRDFMFGINNRDCETDGGTMDFIERNVCEYIENFVDNYFDDDDDCECCCCSDCDGCCDCDDEWVDNYDDAVFEAIDMHNDHVDKMKDLAHALLETYPNVENTPVNEAFNDAFGSMFGQAIWLCCEANSIDGDGWMTTSDFHVVRDDDVED